jgi:hypothetical protein
MPHPLENEVALCERLYDHPHSGNELSLVPILLSLSVPITNDGLMPLQISIPYKSQVDHVLYKLWYLLRDEQDLSLEALMSPIFVMIPIVILCLHGRLCGVLPRSPTSFCRYSIGNAFWSK